LLLRDVFVRICAQALDELALLGGLEVGAEDGLTASKNPESDLIVARRFTRRSELILIFEGARQNSHLA
jgi:hypothetical protein